MINFHIAKENVDTIRRIVTKNKKKKKNKKACIKQAN